MGFAVDLVVHMRSCYLPGVVDHHEQWTWSDPYREYGLRLADSQEFEIIDRVLRQVLTEAWDRIVRH